MSIPEKLPIKKWTGRSRLIAINLPIIFDYKQTENEIYQRYNAYADHQALIKQLIGVCGIAKTNLKKAQGEWVGVAVPYAPEWASEMAQTVDDIDAALAAAEKQNEPT